MRGRTVLFGGYDGVSSLADTWDNVGVNWNRVLTATSPPRLGHPAGGPKLAGTNPLAIAIPSSEGSPVVRDVSWGRVTYGDVIAGAATEDDLVPFGGEHAHKAFAAALGLQDPRERPLAAQQKADEAHRKFKEEGSDFAGYLKLWAFWQDGRGSRNKMYKLARENFLSYNRMREWEDIHAQIVQVMREWDFQPNDKAASGEQLHRALLPGLLSKIAGQVDCWVEQMVAGDNVAEDAA